MNPIGYSHQIKYLKDKSYVESINLCHNLFFKKSMSMTTEICWRVKYFVSCWPIIVIFTKTGKLRTCPDEGNEEGLRL